jgi:hypothetical protein
MLHKLKMSPVKFPLTSRISGVSKGGSVGAGVGILLGLASVVPAQALPPPEDIPEEILRTEIILSARSPVDGKPLTAAQYAELQSFLQTRRTPPELNSKVRDTVFLLRLRQTLRTFFPFLPI